MAMFVSVFLTLFLACSSVLITETSRELRACINDSPSEIGTTSNQEAWERGCQIAFALRKAPEDNTPSCEDSCKAAYTDSVEHMNYCTSACNKFGSEKKPIIIPLHGSSIISTMMHNLANGMFHRMRDMVHNFLPSHQPAMQGAKMAPDTDSHYTVTRFRIIIPLGESERGEENPLLSAFNGPESIPVHISAHHQKAQTHSIKSSQFGSSDNSWRVGCILRNAMADPLRLLLILTSVTLVLLFIIQIAVYVRRRRYRTTTGFQFSELPSYDDVFAGTQGMIKKPEKTVEVVEA